jgi:sugar/nucleoside kinase (ribokinase family)
MSRFDVLCIGNAIVDIIARCDEAFLVDNSIIKGAMNLIDADRAELLYSRMGPAIEASGGSAGNTAAGIASFGSRVGLFRQGVRRPARQDLQPRHPRAGCAFRHKAADRTHRRPHDR